MAWRANFQMSAIWPIVRNPQRFLYPMVDESPNNDLTPTTAKSEHIYFLKLDSKLAKMGLL
jgi:hypothetical protein